MERSTGCEDPPASSSLGDAGASVRDTPGLGGAAAVAGPPQLWEDAASRQASTIPDIDDLLAQRSASLSGANCSNSAAGPSSTAGPDATVGGADAGPAVGLNSSTVIPELANTASSAAVCAPGTCCAQQRLADAGSGQSAGGASGSPNAAAALKAASCGCGIVPDGAEGGQPSPGAHELGVDAEGAPGLDVAVGGPGAAAGGAAALGEDAWEVVSRGGVPVLDPVSGEVAALETVRNFVRSLNCEQNELDRLRAAKQVGWGMGLACGVSSGAGVNMFA